MNVILTFNVDEVNKILKGLGELPHKESYELIGKIVREAEAQVKAKETPKEDNDSGIV